MENKRKERKSFRKVFLIVPILFLMIVTLSVATYAWWNSLQTNKNVEVEIGDRVTIVANSATGFEFGSGLVPIGTDLINGQVNVVTGTIVLNITGIDVEKDNVDLVVTNNLPTELQNVFIITYNGDSNGVFTNVTDGTLPVEIIIQLDEDEAKYTPEVLADLVNKNYNIAFTFKLVPNPQP